MGLPLLSIPCEGMGSVVAESRFEDIEILSQEEIIVSALRKLLQTFAEISRREEVTKDFLKQLCSFNLETGVWFLLWESGGSQRFTDILRVIGCSRGKLSKVLRNLLGAGLIRMVDERYQAVSPAWLVRLPTPTKKKH